MYIVEPAKCFEGIENPGMYGIGRVPHDRKTNKVDVVRQILCPVIHDRVEGKAMRAAVPEDFGDFDNIRCAARALRRRQLYVMGIHLENFCVAGATGVSA